MYSLKPGDTIAITATARKITEEEILPAVNIFKSWGLQVVYGKHLFAEQNQFAGTDTQRAESLQLLLDDENVHAIICARGGYGTVRIIDNLDFAKFCKKTKWLIGYSDITVLHTHINQNFSLPTLHATMPINMQNHNANLPCVEALKNVLFGSTNSILVEPNALNKNVTNFEGEIVGGNLSVLYSILGSKSDINTDGKILFIEDLDEYLYHIDRMLIGLKRAGKFKNLKALLVGGMSQMRDNTVPFGKTAEEIIVDVFSEYNYPIIFNIPAGHEDVNMPIVLGANVDVVIESDKINIIQKLT